MDEAAKRACPATASSNATAFSAEARQLFTLFTIGVTTSTLGWDLVTSPNVTRPLTSVLTRLCLR